MLDSTIDY